MLKNTAKTDLGRIQVSDEAIAEIASTAALRVEGVSAMGSSGRVENLAQVLGLDRGGRGVQVEMSGRELSLRLSILLDFGADVAEVGLSVQEAVAAAVEQMTGLDVRDGTWPSRACARRPSGSASMKAFNILLVALAVLILAALGSGLIALVTLPGLAAGLHEGHQLLDNALQADNNLRWGLVAVGTLLLLLALGAVWGNFSMRRWERTVVFHNPLGEVMVSLTALEDIGRLAKAELPGVKDLKLKVLASRRGLRATARVVLFSDANVPSTTEAIQECVRRRLAEVVGDTQDIRPRVMVSKVALRGPGEESDDVLVYRPYGRARRPPRP
jgi:uncharacterized alkaline shock family protein YloU